MGVARCATIRTDPPFSCTRSTFQPSAKFVDAPDARPERRLEKLDGVRLQQSGLQHRRPEPSQVRWRREIRAGAEQTRVVTPRRLLHAQLRVHICPWEVERRGVRELIVRLDDGALHAERREHLSRHERGKRLSGRRLHHCAEEDPAVGGKAVLGARLKQKRFDGDDRSASSRLAQSRAGMLSLLSPRIT